ncbi:hypothetical protein AB0D14_41355 [Streptomyces sp. NPDC048484]|uniref:hypothetical protein n=1 Tax=Streptomyces sp. NPDC048484 TaxID=3155146 RepID=UPI003446E5D2
MNSDYPPPPTDPPRPFPHPSKPRRVHPLVAALAGVVLGAGAVGTAWAIVGDSHNTPKTNPSSAAPPSPGTFALTGTFELTNGVIDDGLGGCQGGDGYDDIFEGTAVTVYDGAGTVIATGHLGESTLESDGTCTFEVSVGDVPAGKDFYKVEASHRGTVQLSEAEAEAGTFGASLG